MDSKKWRRELDKISELKGMLVSVNPTLDEQASRQVRQLYELFASFAKLENELSSAGFLGKRKVQTQVEKVGGDLEDEFMRVVRDFAELYRKEKKSVTELMSKLEEMKPKEAKAVASIPFPSVAAGDFQDFEKLFGFAETFSKQYSSLRNDIARETKELHDENRGTVETYERHITIDRSAVTTSVSNQDVLGLPLTDLIILSDKLKEEKEYLDGRKDEVGRMLGVSLMSDVESLQSSVETATRLGLDLPMDFSQKLRMLARDASKATDLTTLLALENQMHSSRLQIANMLRDRIINMKHEVTSKIVEGGIPVTSDVLPTAPVISTETEDVPTLLSSYQEMVGWEGQVKIALKDQIEEILEDISKATDSPEDTGIKDVVSVREFLAEAKKDLKKNEIDYMIRVHTHAKQMDEAHRKAVTDSIRKYLTRFNELATSADRVLDHAQLSKKAPRVEELEGGIVYLLQSLKNLRDAVESGVATFRQACEQEIDAIIQDLQTIKPAYAEIFLPIIVDLEEGSAKINKLTEFAEIRSEMRTTKESILAKAQEALENLRYRLSIKIRLAAAKLLGAGVELPEDVQEAISELNNIGVAADNVFSLPAIARKMIEIYEKRITGNVLESLEKEVKGLLDSFGKAASIGVPLVEELETLQKLKDEPPTELEDAADAFDVLASLTTSNTIQEKIRNRADDAYKQIKGAVSIFEQQGKQDFVDRLNTLLDQVPSKMREEDKFVTDSLEVCLTLANIQDEMLGVIKSIAGQDGEDHTKEIKNRSKYYSTIERVYETHPDEFSDLIYDLSKIKELEKSLSDAVQLNEALEYFNKLKELRMGWVEKAEKMDDWHKSMKMFMTGFSPAASADERTKFIDDAVRKIKETYSREDISSYLTWAIKEIMKSMVEKRG